MKTMIYHLPSAGCQIDAMILSSAISPALPAHGKPSLMSFPTSLTADAFAQHPSAAAEIDCAYFIERPVDHPALMKARHRILIPNAEWLDARAIQLARRCTHVWHKSLFSLERLAPLLPDAEHVYLGFTSYDPGRRVTGYDSFVHLRGKLHTNRNSNHLFSAWHAHRQWPDLYVHFYWHKDRDLHYPGWLHDENVHVKMGWLDRRSYFDLATRHGIHLCTSEIEGFGHYINEARAMEALIVTVDGSPMNELIDDDCGILIRPSESIAMNQGIRYRVTSDEICLGVERALSLTPQARRDLGVAARRRFLAERNAFLERVQDLHVGLAS